MNKNMIIGIVWIGTGIIIMAIFGMIGNYYIQKARTELSKESTQKLKETNNTNANKILDKISNLDNKFDSLTKRQKAFELYIKNSIDPKLEKIILQNGYTLKQIQSMAEQAKKDSQDDFEIGNAYFISKNYSKALQYFKESLKRTPENIPTNIYFNIGQAKLKILENKGLNIINDRAINDKIKKELKDIVNDFSSAIEQNENDFLSYNNRGVIYLKLNQLEKAEFDFEKSRNINPNHSLSYINLSKTYLLKNNQKYINPALVLLNKAIAIDPDNKIVYYNRANLYERYLNDFPNAINDYEKAIENGFINKHIYLNMGTTYARWFQQNKNKKNLKLAKDFYEKSLAIDTSFLEAKQGLKNLKNIN